MISIASSVGVIPSPVTASASAAARPACSITTVSTSVDVKSSYSSSVSSLSSVVANPFNCLIRRGRRICSEVTVKSDSRGSSSATVVSAAATSLSEEETGEAAATRIGAKVRVKVPLKVYHVAKLPEANLEGMEGVLKDYVRVWKGKHVSANLPYKVEFVVPVEGRPPVKFVAHLKEDEFEYV
ncbi:hypothetical protein SDJN02_25609, partial [Cucurbita argyrosperma subsp. argyrosperma]|uniref:Ferredoxin-thioredoxin reductase, variable chain-like n=2 Tax=Cucurbita TaxID=3660 RepID=A0A6J1G052_CUCMO